MKNKRMAATINNSEQGAIDKIESKIVAVSVVEIVFFQWLVIILCFSKKMKSLLRKTEITIPYIVSILRRNWFMLTSRF